MPMRTHRFFLPGLYMLLILASAAGWFSFMGFGIAYGSLVGLPGREYALAELGRKAEVALAFGAAFEGIAIGIACWKLVPVAVKWIRMSAALAAAGIVDLLTFAVIKAI